MVRSAINEGRNLMTVRAPISKFPQVDQGDASGELAEIYDDIRFTLRMPWVPFAIRVLSLFPAFVPAAWQKLKPQISTAYAEKGADLVREAGFSDVGGVSRRQMSDSLSEPEIAGLTGLLFMYNSFIADITIAMIRVKQALDGASSATANKFSVA
jgi:hypothetical protein